MKSQATKASPTQVHMHIRRQRALGSRLIGDNDSPRRIELLATALGLLILLLIHMRHTA